MTEVGVPYVTADQMREVDRLAVDEFGITLLQMMENAGRALARLGRQRFLAGDARGKRVLVLAGSGGNGGGGLVCARNLHNWGADVRVLATAPPERMGDVPAHQARILETVGVPIDVAPPDVGSGGAHLPDADLVVDALIGYSLRCAPSGTAAALVRAANQHGASILALDVPTGVDSTTGEVAGDAVRADATLTLALPKEGLRAAAAAAYVGELYLADISIPAELYARPSLGIEVGALFASDDIIRLDEGGRAARARERSPRG